ncbi:MAG: glutamyl-tRNA reductase [Pirellulales bacterium]|nr:glutamyl-tRNA reductase [Pirellulales bacterium]
MTVQVVGCSHHETPIEVRERLAIGPEQVDAALARWAVEQPDTELVLLSTCNRLEFYLASNESSLPGVDEVAAFLASVHDVVPGQLSASLYCKKDRDAAAHLFTVAASLDSMVLGEPQILAQVKDAYQRATAAESVGPLGHALFQSAIMVARRVANETALYQRRTSIPSVAVADFAAEIFERFDDKKALVLGAGDMAEETLCYLRDAGVREILVANRTADRAAALAAQWQAEARPWENLADALVEADLVVSTTAAGEPIVTLDDFVAIEPKRSGRPLFVLDLAVPRDFDPAIGARPDVFLYSIDDLQAACDANRRAREKELPTARRIIAAEADRFMARLHHRATNPVIRRLKHGWQQPKEEELRRLFNKLPDLDEASQAEIRRAFDRFVSKLLHPPLESLRDESRQGIPSALLDALARLFQLKD